MTDPHRQRLVSVRPDTLTQKLFLQRGSCMSGGDDAELRGRVRRLLEFLRETVSSQAKPVRAYGPSSQIEWL